MGVLVSPHPGLSLYAYDAFNQVFRFDDSDGSVTRTVLHEKSGISSVKWLKRSAVGIHGMADNCESSSLL